MKLLFSLAFILTALLAQAQIANPNKTAPEAPASGENQVLRHVVLFKFRDGTPQEKIREIEGAFSQLPEKIAHIRSFEWGLNNSPEGLNKGFTHCFFLTFASEEDRDAYLPHPDHKAFGALLGPWLEDVLVVDYWTHSMEN
ncbi:Dabb family protein [Robiginitalea marina]|uniref:Dabb family protein n=1 Tax=Robiginitalea marina TaxID=2954105 RepID=A0ABT1AXF6_9FLAO|nr:Dabb family protein [Robiginitalea marina]MCO5724043.1 Dabb family protein [Robiginitalea marina]